MARILLIEDEELARFTLRRILEGGGHDVYEASDGDEGVAEFKIMITENSGPHIIITDILMPKKSGYDTITEIKRLMPGIKIIAISGGGGVDPKVFLDISNVLGADQTLSKPFLPEDLLAAVDNCLK